MTLEQIRSTSYFVALGATAMTFILMLGQLSGTLDALVLGISLWILVPYMILALLVRFQSKQVRRAKLIMWGTIIISGLSMLLLCDALLIHVDAQNALVFVFLPVYQIMACLLLSVVGVVFCRRGDPQP